MVKRLIISIIIYISAAVIFSAAYAQGALKINSINFDNSDSIIFLGTAENEETTDINITKKILSDPERVFFDVENAVLTFPAKTFELKNSRLQKVRIAQNSVAPDVVRIVIWNSPDYNSSQIKILNIKNNIIIKLSNEIPLQQYLTQIYKETKESAAEYNDKTVVITEEDKTQEADEIFNKVQQAFKEDNQELVRPNIEQRQARLKSRFFLEKAEARDGNLLIGGIGVINAEKPFILQEPARVVFDLPDTIVLQELRDKEFNLSDTETFKIGQFEPSKARIVIKTNNHAKFIPIYSTNLQTLLIAKSSSISGIKTSHIKSELAYFKEQTVNTSTGIINIIFSQPVIYSIKREETKLIVTFYNLINFNIDSFNAVAEKNKTGFEAAQYGSDIFTIFFPVNSDTLVDCYETLNASQLRFVFTKKRLQTYEKPLVPDVKDIIPLPSREESVQKSERVKKESPFANLLERAQTNKQQKTSKKKLTKTQITATEKIKNKIIIIDPGHGGNDTGALRNNISEKDLTLDIALKIRECLKEKGFKNVIMTRSTDKTLTLEDRVKIANSSKADIFVSIHINASVKSEIKGLETHYYSNSGYYAAKVIHKKLTENIDTPDRGLFKSKFYVINHTEAPAVLLELGFISNENERSSLNSEERQQVSAQAVADGIAVYLTEH